MWSRMLAIAIYLIFQACVSCTNIDCNLENRITFNPQELREMAGTAALHNSHTDFRSSTHKCGAALISVRLISISLGRDDLNVNACPGNDTYTILIEEVVIHPGYGSAAHDYNDIAIIKTDRKVRYSDNIWPFCLPAKNQVFPDYRPVQIAGWGQLNRVVKASVLETAYILLVSQSRCDSLWRQLAPSFYDDILESTYPQGITDQLLCARREGVDACKGDSGGPMANLNSDGRRTVIGIISKGINCPRRPIIPSFYTNVANYIDWIYDTTGLSQISAATNCGKTVTNNAIQATPTPRPQTRPTPRPQTRPTPRPQTRPTRPQTRPTPPPQPTPTPRPTAGCPLGFFKSKGSNQCFKFFNDHNRNWEEAKKKCNEEGLLMAKPDDAAAAALRKDLVDTYGDANVWLAARGDGSKIVWQRDGTTLSKNNPLWYNGSNLGGVATRHCLGMASWPNALSSQPGRPYRIYECRERSRSTLCEERV